MKKKEEDQKEWKAPKFTEDDFKEWTGLFLELAREVAKNYAWSEDQCEALSHELFYALLCKACYMGDSMLLSLPPNLDMLWHEFILNCKDYREFCNTVCDGVFLHHTQFTVDDALSVKNDRVCLTLKIYSSIFPNRTPNKW